MKVSFKEDRKLLSQCLAGDRKASEDFVRRFSNLVYKYVQYTLMAKNVRFNREDLEDLHNTVFLRLFEQNCRKLQQYQGKNGCSLASWIRMIAVRTVIDHLRKKGVDTMVWQKKKVPLEDVPELRDHSDGVEIRIEEAEKARLLQKGIQRLSPRYRLFMRLHFDQGLPVAQVAETMKLSMDNAYTLKHRAIQSLKSHVASMMNDHF